MCHGLLWHAWVGETGVLNRGVKWPEHRPPSSRESGPDVAIVAKLVYNTKCLHPLS